VVSWQETENAGEFLWQFSSVVRMVGLYMEVADEWKWQGIRAVPVYEMYEEGSVSL